VIGAARNPELRNIVRSLRGGKEALHNNDHLGISNLSSRSPVRWMRIRGVAAFVFDLARQS